MAAERGDEVGRTVDPDPGAAARPEHRLEQPLAQSPADGGQRVTLGEGPRFLDVDVAAGLLHGQGHGTGAGGAAGALGQPAASEERRPESGVQRR